MNFEDIVEAIQLGKVLPSRHSRKEAADDDLVSQTARLITVYRPSPNRWINWRQRRWKN